MKNTYVFLSLALFLFYFGFFTTKIFAAPVFEEDFSGSYEKWQDVRQTFNLWNLKNQAAHVFINKRSTLAELIPKAEYWNPEWKNYSYEVEINYVQGVDKMLAFWFQDILNWYQIHFVGGNYILSHIADGKEVWNAVGPISLTAKNKLRVELIDGKISLFINNLHAFTHTDPTFDDDYGSIALKAGAGAIFPAEVFFDSISVSLLNNYAVELSVPFFSQANQIWASQEYDSAKNWSEKQYSIKDWGCLLSSITMTLHYHSITKFPNNIDITPATLNQWLQEQEDGFIGEGLINWTAITRLVKEIHDTHGTIKLEYSRITDNQLSIAATYLKQSVPVIFQVPGHFLVGSGLTEIAENLQLDHFLILDPLYSYTRLAEHFDSNEEDETTLNEPISTRLLTPTNTDLSYIYIAHSPNVKVTFLGKDNKEFASYQTNTDFLISADQSEKSKKTVVHELQQPNTDNYIFSFESVNGQVDFTKEDITIFTYDEEANLTNLTASIALHKNQKVFAEINYKKDAVSTLVFQYSFADLLSDLRTLKQNNLLGNEYTFVQLGFMAEKAHVFETNDFDYFNKKLRGRYLLALQSEIDWFSTTLPSETKTFLENRLKLLAQH